MPFQRRRKLDALVAQLQLEHGPHALRRASEAGIAPQALRISTTFPELDALLGGGLPRGRLSELSGPATSGKVTLAAKVIAAAHRQGDALAAWVDFSRTCDADYFHRCGIDLDRLLVVRPETFADALALTLHLAESNALAVLAFDASPAIPPDEGLLTGALARLTTLLARTETVALFLVEPQMRSQALAHAAAVRLAIHRDRWIVRGKDVRGYEALAEVLKNRLGQAGATVLLRITFNGTVRGGGLW